MGSYCLTDLTRCLIHLLPPTFSVCQAWVAVPGTDQHDFGNCFFEFIVKGVPLLILFITSAGKVHMYILLFFFFINIILYYIILYIYIYVCI